MHGLVVYVKEVLHFAQDLSLENAADSYLYFWLALLQSVSYFFFLYQLLSLSLSKIFYSISSNIDDVLLINPYANVFVFGDFNVHHKDSLTYSGGTDQPCELCYSFSISNDLTQMVNFPTRISGCDSHSPVLLDLFISSDTSICSTMAFPPLRNYDHVLVSVSIDFPSNSEPEAPFHHIAYDSSCTDWDHFLIIWGTLHLRISLSSVLVLLLVSFAGGFRLKLMYISLIENIRSSLTHPMVFSCLCCCHSS